MEAKFSKENIERTRDALKPKHAKLVKTFIKNNGISNSLLTENSGVYIFWWEGSIESFTKTVTNSTFLVNGKKSHKDQIKICFTEEWIQNATHENKICLYVGKTTSLRDRISKHIKLGTPTLWENKKRNSGTKPNTVSQMRIGLETVYDKDMLKEIINQVSISYYSMNKYSEAINRFYVEDYFIAHYFPLFNIDIER